MRTDTELLDGLIKLAAVGGSPAVINDDNGHWAVSEEGYQTISVGKEPKDCQTTFFIAADKWKDSIREAVNTYLDENLDEPD